MCSRTRNRLAAGVWWSLPQSLDQRLDLASLQSLHLRNRGVASPPVGFFDEPVLSDEKACTCACCFSSFSSRTASHLLIYPARGRLREGGREGRKGDKWQCPSWSRLSSCTVSSSARFWAEPGRAGPGRPSLAVGSATSKPFVCPCARASCFFERLRLPSLSPSRDCPPSLPLVAAFPLSLSWRGVAAVRAVPRLLAATDGPLAV